MLLPGRSLLHDLLTSSLLLLNELLLILNQLLLFLHAVLLFLYDALLFLYLPLRCFCDGLLSLHLFL